MKYLSIFLISIFSYASSIITPVPSFIQYDKEKALLGKKLFFGKNLPANVFMCGHCHHKEHGMTSNKIVNLTFDNKKVALNPITLYNASFDSYFGYEGSSKSLYNAVYSAIHNHEEMKIL